MEDNLTGLIKSLEESSETFERVLHKQVFFDAPELKPLILEATESIKNSRYSLMEFIQKFTDFKKRRYVIIEEEKEEEEEELE